MALSFPPALGSIVMCEFPHCHVPPEMVKVRPVIVVNKKLKGRDPELVTVVPISMTPPETPMEYHCEIPLHLMPQPLRGKPGERWAKCDMLYTLHIQRLSFVQGPKSAARGGRRADVKGALDLVTLQQVRRAVAHAIGIDAATFPNQEVKVEIAITNVTETTAA